jgi:ElaB/YqjD/DUF883 family membrane-anchored ribosome-binding protein
MIAPADSSYPTKVRDLDVAKAATGFAEKPIAAEKAIAATKQWVSRHSTTAVVASVVLGLLVGYVVKRRNH